jgi:hypothetical protein
MDPATQAIERYYAAFNQKDWSAIAAMFDLPGRSSSAAEDPLGRA